MATPAQIDAATAAIAQHLGLKAALPYHAALAAIAIAAAEKIAPDARSEAAAKAVCDKMTGSMAAHFWASPAMQIVYRGIADAALKAAETARPKMPA